MKRRHGVVFAVIAVGGLSFILSAGALIENASQGETYSNVSSIPYRRVGLLLGCSQRLSDGRENLFFAYRIAAAAQLFKAHKIDYIIVSGDNHTAGYDESTDMKHALINSGVSPERVYCDFAGFRTFDSIVRAKEVFGQTEITIISQKFHNQRAIYIARNRSIDALGFNAEQVDSYNGFRTMIREQFARVRTVLDVYLFRAHPKFLGPKVRIGNET